VNPGEKRKQFFQFAIILPCACSGWLTAARRLPCQRERFEIFLAQAFAERVLPFDQRAAKLYGEIAAIARLHGFTLATRNTKDFKDCDIALINPFLA
jgi:predicted nucleic acid-binding protein